MTKKKEENEKYFLDTQLWEKIYATLDDNILPKLVSKDITTEKKKVDIDRLRNDMFTANKIKANEIWKQFKLTEFRNVTIVKPMVDGKYYDDRILFILPYTTIKKESTFIDMYYCIIEDPNSPNNTIFNFSILTETELKKLFGVEINQQTDNLLEYVSNKVMNNLDSIISLKESNTNKDIIKQFIKGLLKD